MTDVRLTQEAVEEWATGTPVVQVTQFLVEEWATVATGPVVVPPEPGTDTRVIVMA